MQQMEVCRQNKQTFFLERRPIWYKAMVRQLNNRWNRLCLSLHLLQAKLADRGVSLENGEIAYIGRWNDGRGD